MIICSAAITLPALPAPRWPPAGMPKRPQNAVNANHTVATRKTTRATFSSAVVPFMAGRPRNLPQGAHSLANYAPFVASSAAVLLPKSKLGWVFAVTAVLCWAVILGMIAYVLWPTLADRSTIGAHDWDQMESHRYLVDKTILDFHQFPFWNPYACGGHPNWGGFESGTTVVSPWLPFYLTMTLPHAMRVEVFGSAFISAVGAWLLAARFTRSAAARALVVVAFAVNGRWALQLTPGHTWHLVYAWTPWVLYFYDRAVGHDPHAAPPRLALRGDSAARSSR